MIYLVQGLMATQDEHEYRRFIGSPEHLRRMQHHIDALNGLRTSRIRAGRPFRMIVIGMGSPAETASVRFSGGQHALIDGPFAETKEVLAGFNLIDFPTRDEALAFARSEHVADGEYTQVVRGVTRMWWGESIKSAVSASLFLLRIYAAEPLRQAAAAEEETLFRHILGIGAEYAQGRGTIDDNNLAWSIAMLEPFTGTAISFNGGQMTTVGVPRTPDGKIEVAFVIAACASMEDAQQWARKLAGDTASVEVRSITRCSWTSLD